MAQPLDVLFLVRSLHVGGAERQLSLLAMQMHAAGHRVRVVVFYAGGDFEADLAAAGVPVISLNKGGRWDVLPFFRRLLAVLRQTRPAIVHAYLPMANVLATLATRWTGIGTLVWGVRASDFNPAALGWMGRLEYALETALSRYAALIVCNSQRGLAIAAKKGFPPAKLLCIPNGVDTQRFRPDAAARRQQRAAWGVDECHVVFGLVGRIDPVKNHAGFLVAAAQLVESCPAARFVVAGYDPAGRRPALQQQAVTLGIADRMIWQDGTQAMPAVYNGLDWLVSASHSEGSPNVLGEAMACGVPGITTDTGDAAWLLAEGGYVVPVGDTAALAAALRQAYATGGAALASPRARVEQVFSAGNLLTNTESALRAVQPKGN